MQQQVAELERLNRLRRFLAPQLAELIAGDEQLLHSHRAEITTLCCVLRGFTAFAEAVEPEEVMALLRDYHQAIGPLVVDFEATLDRFAGDALLVFFNDPLPCPNPPWQAVQLAVAIRERVAELARSWHKRGHELDVGIAVAQGYATLGKLGFEGRFDYGAIGPVTNLAHASVRRNTAGPDLAYPPGLRGGRAAGGGRAGGGAQPPGRAPAGRSYITSCN